MKQQEISELGFSEGEIQLYTALLELGKANVAQLSQKTGRHRTHIYDTLEKLKEKGLVSESKIDNKKLVIPANPENILNYFKEKEENAKALVNELKQKQNIGIDEVNVETYKGTSGLKSVFRDIIKEKKDYVGFGEGGKFQIILPDFFEQFRGQSEKLGINLRLILKKGVNIPGRKGLTVKHLDYVSPSTTFIYADKVLIIIWQPFPTAIRITDKQTANSYKSYFELLWKIAHK